MIRFGIALPWPVIRKRGGGDGNRVRAHNSDFWICMYSSSISLYNDIQFIYKCSSEIRWTQLNCSQNETILMLWKPEWKGRGWDTGKRWQRFGRRGLGQTANYQLTDWDCRGANLYNGDEKQGFCCSIILEMLTRQEYRRFSRTLFWLETA